AGCGRGPGIDQGHLHNVEAVAGVANERAPVGHVHVDIRAFIKMVSVIRVAITHDGIRDNGINFNSGNTVAAVGDRPQDVKATARCLRRTPLAQSMSARRPEKLNAMRQRRTAARTPSSRLKRVSELHTIAAIAEVNAANRIALGPPIQFSNGTTARQATAPPIRSAPSTRVMREDSRANIAEHW